MRADTSPRLPTPAAKQPTADRAFAAFSAWLSAYRRVWRGTAVTTVVVPILNLLAMGYGLGALVDRHGGVSGMAYAAFLGPGLLAAAVLQTAADEGTFPVMGALRWTRTYYAMSATPLTSRDIFVGHLLFVLGRAVSGAAVFLVVLVVFRLVDHPSALLV